MESSFSWQVLRRLFRRHCPLSPPPPLQRYLRGLLCSLACGVYLLHSLPAILFPSGMLASVLTLLAGVLLGLAGAAAALVSTPVRSW